MLILANTTADIIREIPVIDEIGDISISSSIYIASGCEANLQPIENTEEDMSQGTQFVATHLLVIHSQDTGLFDVPVIEDKVICGGKRYNIISIKRDELPSNFPRILDTYRFTLRNTEDKS